MTPDHYDLLTKQAEDAFVHGELEQACKLLEQAEAEASAVKEDELVYKAFCRRCFILGELKLLTDQTVISRLSEILLRSRELGTRCMAAYYAGIAYHDRGDHAKAMRYAERSLGMAEETGEPQKVAAAAHLIGNLELISSNFDHAEAAYQRSLDQYTGNGSFHDHMEAQVRDNLGYIKICTGYYHEGIALCEEALRVFEEIESTHALPQVFQDLCYGYILCDMLNEAQECGERGLELALSFDNRLVAKNLHFLLAEVAIRSGDRFRARRYLTELAQYYPEIPESDEIVDVLMGMDFTEVVNLRG